MHLHMNTEQIKNDFVILLKQVKKEALLKRSVRISFQKQTWGDNGETEQEI